MCRMMDLPSRSGCPCRSPSRVGDNTMEALKEFLQHMSRTIEFLCNRCNKELTSSITENPDAQTASPIAMASDPSRTLPSVGESAGTHLCGKKSTLQLPSNGGEGNFSQMQDLSSQGCTMEENIKGGRSCTFEEIRVNANSFKKEEVILGKKLNNNSQGHSLERDDNDPLRMLLEDMKKTIESWSLRHNVLLQTRSMFAREGVDLLDAFETTRITHAARPQPSDSMVQDIDLHDSGSHEVSFPCDKGKDYALDRLSGEATEEKTCEMPQSDYVSQGCTGQTEGACFVQPEDQKKKSNSLLPQLEQGETDACILPSPSVGKDRASEVSQRNHEALSQDFTDLQGQSKEENLGFGCASPMRLELDSVHSQSQLDHGEMDVEITSRNGTGQIENTKPKLNQAEPESRPNDSILKTAPPGIVIPLNNNESVRETAIQRHCRRVEVVGSPDWLPKGWITEMKTRNNGQSAGSRDKNFYDPVSKRRFRSKKEVFCFLETGKLGRYKKRTKIPPIKKPLGPELALAGQALDSCQPRNANGSEASGMASSSISEQNTVSTCGPSTPMGVFSNRFVPYRPGQPSEWRVYDSLATVPLPVFDHFRYTEYNTGKSMGNWNPAYHPWFSNNPDFSQRPFVDKSNTVQTEEKSKDCQIFELSEGETANSKSMQRKSGTAAKKFSKKNTT